MTGRNGVCGRRRLACVLLLSLALGACGGGLFIGVELGSDGDLPPSVALTASADQAVAGAVVRLAAAASDDFGVDAVSFYREEQDGSTTLLGSDGATPFQLDTAIPVSPAGTVWRYFARAFDGAGQHSDSERVAVSVR